MVKARELKHLVKVGKRSWQVCDRTSFSLLLAWKLDSFLFSTSLQKGSSMLRRTLASDVNCEVRNRPAWM